MKTKLDPFVWLAAVGFLTCVVLTVRDCNLEADCKRQTCEVGLTPTFLSGAGCRCLATPKPRQW